MGVAWSARGGAGGPYKRSLGLKPCVAANPPEERGKIIPKFVK